VPRQPRTSRRPLRVAVAQPPCAPYDVVANVAAHCQPVRASRARVVVFPELSLTGYELDASPIAPDDERLLPLVAACAEADAIALVGAPVADADGARYIATLAVRGSGASVVYRKINLHPPEPESFAAGEALGSIEVDGWTLGLAICRDTGVPAHVADTVGLGIDAYVASTVFVAGEAAERDRRMSDVAHKYDVWAVLSAYAGDIRSLGATTGGSGVWAPGGELAAQASADPGDWAAAVLTDE